MFWWKGQKSYEELLEEIDPVDLEELGKQARAAVQAYEEQDAGVNDDEVEPENSAASQHHSHREVLN